MQRIVSSLAIQLNNYTQYTKSFCMSARTGQKKVKNLRVSRVPLPVAKKRKLLNFLAQTPAMMESASDKRKVCEKVIYLPEPVKSQNDKKEYRLLPSIFFAIQ